MTRHYIRRAECPRCGHWDMEIAVDDNGRMIGDYFVCSQGCGGARTIMDVLK